ncbi:MAG: response regulator [Ardenticatenaceae bacterium]|nr:response regulator [Ardenticatenaceae bacterium]
MSNAESSATGPNVLIVDDSPVNLRLLAQILNNMDYMVRPAKNGRIALASAKAAPPDLILLDIMMPEMNGFEVLARLKSDPDLRDIPVLIISALDDMDSIVKGIKMGAEDYLPKPFERVLLQARIETCLEKKQLRDREKLHLQQIEAEKRRADELLHVILPNAIVAELKATDGVQPRLYQNVAVLFADVVGFTPYCETHTPEDVLMNLQALVEVYEKITFAYDLQKIKTVGDAFMATAGLLNVLDNPVAHCVRSAFKMIAAAPKLPAGWQVRIGIHIGPVIAGIVGHRQYLFDLWGDTVNTAQRIESQGPPGTISLSRVAYEQVADYWRAEARGCIPVKGKGELEIFQIVTA